MKKEYTKPTLFILDIKDMTIMMCACSADDTNPYR